jgi:hypothetical protein
MGDDRDLVFYQKAREVIKDINDLIRTGPKTMQAEEISRQLFQSVQLLQKGMAGIKVRRASATTRQITMLNLI